MCKCAHSFPARKAGVPCALLRAGRMLSAMTCSMCGKDGHGPEFHVPAEARAGVASKRSGAIGVVSFGVGVLAVVLAALGHPSGLWLLVLPFSVLVVRRAADQDRQRKGVVRPALICPHCRTAGRVVVGIDQRKAGVSAGKVAGALVTSGVSLAATGVSRRQRVQTCRCGACGMSWVVPS